MCIAEPTCLELLTFTETKLHLELGYELCLARLPSGNLSLARDKSALQYCERSDLDTGSSRRQILIT